MLESKGQSVMSMDLPIPEWEGRFLVAWTSAQPGEPAVQDAAASDQQQATRGLVRMETKPTFSLQER